MGTLDGEQLHRLAGATMRGSVGVRMKGGIKQFGNLTSWKKLLYFPYPGLFIL